MAINIVKPAKKVEAVEVVGAESLEKMSLEELADQYGSLSDKVESIMMNPAFQRFKEVREELASRLKAEIEPEDSAVLSGVSWSLDIGPAAKNPRVLKPGAIAAVQAWVGVEEFLAIAKVNLSDLDKYLTPQQLNEVVSTDTGYSDKRKIVCSYKGK